MPASPLTLSRRALHRAGHLPLVGGSLLRATNLVRSVWTRWAAAFLIRRYLRRHASPRLQIGAGGDAPGGWLNTDLAPAGWWMPRVDATRPLPFANGTFDLVFSEHMIEHIPLDDSRHMLREIFRVLRPGGRVRIATPDARQLARILLETEASDVREYLDWSADRFGWPADACLPARAVDNLYHGHGHRFLFDEAALRSELLAAGFQQPVRHLPGESRMPELRGLERHAQVIGPAANQFETLVLEALRP